MKIICFLLWIATIIIGADQEDPATACQAGFMFGDSAGDFSLLSNLTVKEVLAIGRELGLPEEFISKVPEDGLSGKTDEDNLGFTYKELDDFLVFGNVPDYDTFANIMGRHQRNLHKVEPMPTFPW